MVLVCLSWVRPQTAGRTLQKSWFTLEVRKHSSKGNSWGFALNVSKVTWIKLQSGPIFALFKVKKWSIFLFFWGFYFFQKYRSPCRKKRIFEKQAQKTTKKTQFLKLKSGPIMLRNIIGPLFNFNLDHFLTLEFCYFFCFFVFFWAETPIFIVFSAKNAKLKETQKRKKDTICEHNCANSSCQNVRFFFFFCIFHFCCFSNFHFFRDVFDRFPKIKKQQNSKARRTKKQQPENKMQSKNKWNVMIQKNTRQQAEQQKQKNILKQKKANTTKRKSKNQKEKMKNRKEGRKKRTRERQRKRKGNLGGRPQKG